MKKKASLGFPLPTVIIIHCFLLLVVRYTAWPEMLAYPYLLKYGFQFYGDIIQPYTPLLPYVVFGASLLFGLSVTLLKIITLVTVVISDLLVWALARQRLSQSRTVIALAFYVLLQIIFDGNGLWFDLFIVPFALFSFYTFILYRKTKNIRYVVASSLCLGIAVIIKQTAVWWGIGALVMLVLSKNYKAVLAFALILIIPYSLLFLFFPAKEFLFWTLIYPFTIATHLPGYVQLPSLRILFKLGVVFIPVLLASRLYQLRLTMLWFGLALLFLYPRFAYFHLQPALPFFALLFASITIPKSLQKLGFTVAIAYLGVVMFWFIQYMRTQSFQAVRFFDTQTIATADRLHTQLSTAKPIFFYNTPAQYFVSAQLVPIKPWADTFPWYLELPGLEEKIISQLDAVDTVVASPFLSGEMYELGAYRPQKIDAYITRHFEKIDEIEGIAILRRTKTVY